MTWTACDQSGIRPNFTTLNVLAEAQRVTSLGRVRRAGVRTDGLGTLTHGKPQWPTKLPLTVQIRTCSSDV